jgi:hypothetical protein
MLLCVAGASLAPTDAVGQGGDPVAAEALFQQGKVLWGQGRWQDACARFEASMAHEASVSVLLKIARCREREGKLAQAWYQYHRALTLNLDQHRDRPGRRQELETFAREALAEIEPRLPRLTVELATTPAGARVTRDDVELPQASLGEALPVDPGPHELLASAPGFSAARELVTLGEREARTVRLILEPTPASTQPDAPARLTPVLVSGPTPALSGAPSEPAPRRWSGARVGSVAAFSASALALGGAAYLGIETLRLVGRSSAYCTPDNACQPAGLEQREEASRAQRKGLVLLGFGLGLAGMGLTLWVAGSPGASRGRAVVGPGSLALEGAW